MEDHMEYGDLVGLEDGWFYDMTKDKRFHVDEDGTVIDEDGKVLGTIEEDDEEYPDE